VSSGDLRMMMERSKPRLDFGGQGQGKFLDIGRLV
jgi:hypothetical protein